MIDVKPRLLDQARQKIRLKHYSIRTEQTRAIALYLFKRQHVTSYDQHSLLPRLSGVEQS